MLLLCLCIVLLVLVQWTGGLELLLSFHLDMPFDCLSRSQDLSTKSVPSFDFSLLWISHLAQVFCGGDSLFMVKCYSSLPCFWVDSLQCDRQHTLVQV